MEPAADRHHLQQMKAALTLSVHDLDGVGRLVSTLESLVALLERPDESWRRRFDEEWGMLEEVLAVTLDRGTSLDQQGKRLVGEAIAGLQRLVEDALGGDEE